jgi:hypothetical protein
MANTALKPWKRRCRVSDIGKPYRGRTMEAKASIRDIRILVLCSAVALIAAPPTITQMPFVSAIFWLAGPASGVLAIAMWISGKRFPFSGFVGGPLEHKVIATVGILGMCLALIGLAIITHLGIMGVLRIALAERAGPSDWIFPLAAVGAWFALFQRLMRAKGSA